MDAQTLYKQGIVAIRQRKDLAEGRRLLTQSLRLDSTNDMAWLWLSRTVNDPDKALQCVDRALAINPSNRHARTLRDRYRKQLGLPDSDGAVTAPVPDVPSRKEKRPLTPRQQKQIDIWLTRAEAAMSRKQPEKAIELWERVLEIVPDHRVALGQAVRHLVQLDYAHDAQVLVEHALDSGTTSPSVYLTAIDFARRNHDFNRAEDLRLELARLPTTGEELVVKMVDQYLKVSDHGPAEDLLHVAMERFPDSADVLTRMAQFYDQTGRHEKAVRYYNLAADKGGKEADQQLENFRPVLTDRERGSLALAWREAVGFSLVFFAMAWQDAGLDLIAMGTRWIGVLLAFLGGYLIVTATSSPQQRPLAAWLGGNVPDNAGVQRQQRGQAYQDPTTLPIIPMPYRVLFGALGGILLVMAFGLVFSTAIGLLQDPVDPFIPPLELFFTTG